MFICMIIHNQPLDVQYTYKVYLQYTYKVYLHVLAIRPKLKYILSCLGCRYIKILKSYAILELFSITLYTTLTPQIKGKSQCINLISYT